MSRSVPRRLSKMIRTKISIVAAAGLATWAILLAPPALASDDADATLIAIQAVSEGADDARAILENVAPLAASDSSATGIDTSIHGIDVLVAADPVEPIRMGEVGITIPTNASGEAGSTDGAIVTFEGGNADSAVVVKDDGSVQVATVIESDQAPTSFAYQLLLPTSVTWTETPNHDLLATDSTGALVLGIAAPWAKDANGEDVPTRYVMDGTTLTQIVEHRGGEFAYPIVADPWLNADIFLATKWDRAKQKASAVVSTWGRNIQKGVLQGGGISGWQAGQVILRTAGWSELSSKLPVVKTKATYRQQYDCHVLGAYTPIGGPTWDLEGTRRSNPLWTLDPHIHKCNW